jgi:hypothetical protein
MLHVIFDDEVTEQWALEVVGAWQESKNIDITLSFK